MGSVLIQAKCNDMCDIEVWPDETDKCYSYDGYFLNSDYINLSINWGTGTIHDWEHIKEQIAELVGIK